MQKLYKVASDTPNKSQGRMAGFGGRTGADLEIGEKGLSSISTLALGGGSLLIARTRHGTCISLVGFQRRHLSSPSISEADCPHQHHPWHHSNSVWGRAGREGGEGRGGRGREGREGKGGEEREGRGREGKGGEGKGGEGRGREGKGGEGKGWKGKGRGGGGKGGEGRGHEAHNYKFTTNKLF